MSSRADRGAVTVYAACFAVLLALAALMLTQVAGLVRLRHQVAAAADLAALAGSRASVDGRDGCAAARSIAERNDAELLTCRMDYDVATVTTRAIGTWWGHRWAFEQQARAAPASYLRSE